MSNHIHKIDLELDSILRNIQVVVDTIGSKWISRKVGEAKKIQELNKSRLNTRKHSYLYKKPPHPVVQLVLEADKWREDCLKSHRLELRESVVKLATLGMALDKARIQTNFDRLVNRLKNENEFQSAAFEVEVAASYVERGWLVDFVEEGNEKTSDLKVIADNDFTFWVECKRRDELSGRDRLIHDFWVDLESSLIRIMGPNKLNFAIIVKSLSDPDRSQLDILREYILNAIRSGGIGVFDVTTGKATSVVGPTTNFAVIVQKLADPDQELSTSGIGFNASEDFDRVTILSEVKKEETGKTLFKNPAIMAFKNSLPSDLVSGILNDFKAAVKQLPKEGPGVIWIRIPDNSWAKSIDQSFKQAEKLIRNKIGGMQNRRVNAVIILTRIFQKLEKDGSQGLEYRPLMMTIEHSNPRYRIKR